MRNYLASAGFSYNMLDKHDEFNPTEQHITLLKEIYDNLKDRNIVIFLGTELEMMYILSIELAQATISNKRTVEVLTLNDDYTLASKSYLTVIDDAFLANDKQKVIIQRILFEKFKNNNPLIMFFLDTADITRVLGNMLDACKSKIQTIQIGE
ncbi:MAG: hypothetical protein AB7E45_00240 [Candidatus Caldatribacteriota bacterium]|jgi:hypothetical protein